MRKIDSLTDLESAFAEWRQNKRHPREAVPDALLERAQKAAAVHGDQAVVRATRLERSRLWRQRRGQTEKAASRPSSEPAFSRLDLAAPTPPSEGRPLAEVETPDGVKLRVFAGTPEVLHLLSAVFGAGAQR